MFSGGLITTSRWPTNRVAPLDRGKRQRWNGNSLGAWTSPVNHVAVDQASRDWILGLAQVCFSEPSSLVRLSLGIARLGLSGQ